MSKKRIVSAIVIIVLVGVAFGFPTVINYYNDSSDMNKIQYVESKDINISFGSEDVSIDSKLKVLDEYLDSGNTKSAVQLNFEPSADKLAEIYEKINAEIALWFDADIMGLEKNGRYISQLGNFQIKDVELYSIDKISFFQVTGIYDATYPDTVLKIFMDSDCYKIYSIDIYGEIAGEIQYSFEGYQYGVSNTDAKEKNGVEDSNKADIKDNISTDIKDNVSVIYGDMTEYLAQKIGSYYEIESPQIMKSGEDVVSYRVLSNLRWNIKFYDEGTTPAMHIGIADIG